MKTRYGGSNFKKVFVGAVALLSVFFGCCFWSGTLKEAKAESDGMWYYKVLNDGTAEITGSSYGHGYEEIIIPETVGGLKVTAIGNNAFEESRSFRRVVIPNGVTRIGNKAFYLCTSLQKVDIPDSVTSIGDEAFEYCRLTGELNLPKELTYIGDSAFAFCQRLEKITLPSKLSTIGKEAFLDCEIKEITIPQCVDSLYGHPFGYLYDDDSSEHYVKIDVFTIYGYSGTVAESYARDNGFNFVSIGEPDYYVVENGVLIKINNSFGLINANIPDGVTEIGERAFTNCPRLESINIPDSVTRISEYAFDYCYNLKSITISQNVTEIDKCAFIFCFGLNNVIISEGVKTIDNKAFFCCPALKSISIPKSVTFIGEYAFGYMSGDGPDADKIYKKNDFTIYGYAGTAAEVYAKDNGFDFVNLEPKPTEAPTTSANPTKSETVTAKPTQAKPAESASAKTEPATTESVQTEEDTTESAAESDTTVTVIEEITEASTADTTQAEKISTEFATGESSRTETETNDNIQIDKKSGGVMPTIVIVAIAVVGAAGVGGAVVAVRIFIMKKKSK